MRFERLSSQKILGRFWSEEKHDHWGILERTRSQKPGRGTEIRVGDYCNNPSEQQWESEIRWGPWFFLPNGYKIHCSPIFLWTTIIKINSI